MWPHLFDARADVVVYRNAMSVVFGTEGLYKDDIAVAVVIQHNMYITTARADGQAPCIILI